MAAKAKEGGRAPGTTTMAPGVLVTLAKLTAMSIPGVVGVAPLPGGVNRLFRRGVAEGVQIEFDENSVGIDLYLILKQDTNVRNVSRKVQAEVARAIEEMIGMQVTRIDVHIEDIDYTVDFD